MSSLRERVEELTAKWIAQASEYSKLVSRGLLGDNTLATSSTLRECADELEAALTAEEQEDGAMSDLREKLITILLEHETSYIKSSYDKIALYLWKCSCGDEEGRELTWDDCHKKTREHWADKYFAAATPSLHKEGLLVREYLDGSPAWWREHPPNQDSGIAFDADGFAYKRVPAALHKEGAGGCLCNERAEDAYCLVHGAHIDIGLPANEATRTERAQGDFEQWWQKFHVFSTDSDRLDYTIQVLSAPFAAVRDHAKAAWNAASAASPADRTEQEEE